MILWTGLTIELSTVGGGSTGSTIVDRELFDLASDPYETRDLARQLPERVAEMKKRLDAELALEDPEALHSRS